MTTSITLAAIKALLESLPPAPEHIEICINPESRNRYPNFFASLDKANESPFGGTLIPMKNNIYLNIDFGLIHILDDDSYIPLRFA